MRLQYAEIHWDESNSPYSPTFADIYHSRQGGLEESQHVFLNANRLPQRFADTASGTDTFTVAEMGFGSGLNFLLTWQLWQKLAPGTGSLHYLGFEQFPIDQVNLQRFYETWPQLQSSARELLPKLPGNCAGIHRLDLGNRVTLDLYLGDAATLLRQKHQSAVGAGQTENGVNRQHRVDAWFLDGFSPAKNPRLWSPELFQLMAAHSAPDTTLSSYSVASSVVSALQNAGFSTEKQPGFGKKRHMLQARYAPSLAPKKNQEKSDTPWFSLPLNASKAKTAIVIGAGLAGSSSAYSLARRGWKVLVLDSGKQVADGASGNPQAVLHCRLHQQQSAAAEFMVQAYLYALGLYQDSSLALKTNWHGCGVLQLPNALNKRKPLNFGNIEKFYPEDIVRQLSVADSSSFCGVELNLPTWLFSKGGWLDPGLLCEILLQHENIELKLNTPVKSLLATDSGWAALSDSASDAIGEAAVMIIANSYGARQFSQSSDIPLLTSCGQVSSLQSTPRSEALSAVVSGPRSICPAYGEAHMIGASYSDAGDRLVPGLDENDENLSAVSDLFAETDLLSESIVGARVSMRCNSPDQLPVVGLVPKHTENLQHYADLARNARRPVGQSGSYYPQLYINVAHGSYGLSSCPLSAEYLASLINTEHSPLSIAQMDSLNPIRFVIRDLKKQRIKPSANDYKKR